MGPFGPMASEACGLLIKEWAGLSGNRIWSRMCETQREAGGYPHCCNQTETAASPRNLQSSTSERKFDRFFFSLLWFFRERESVFSKREKRNKYIINYNIWI